jgi:tetratricopeptide (TPR) repeat protein
MVGGSTGFTVAGTAASLLAEAPALSPRPDHRTAVEPATVTAMLDRIAPAQPSPALARALDAARAGRYADLLVASPVAADEDAVRATLTGLALLSIGDQNAGTQFQRALLLGAPTAPVHFLLGMVRAMQNRDVDAISSWQAALKAGLPPALVDRHVAGAYLRRGDNQKAATAIAVADDPASAKTWAATRIVTRREAEAIARLDQVLVRDPNDAEARWLLLHALYSEFVHGRPDRRERLVSEAQRYIDAKGPHAALAAEWLKVIISS